MQDLKVGDVVKLYHSCVQEGYFVQNKITTGIIENCEFVITDINHSDITKHKITHVRLENKLEGIILTQVYPHEINLVRKANSVKTKLKQFLCKI